MGESERSGQRERPGRSEIGKEVSSEREIGKVSWRERSGKSSGEGERSRERFGGIGRESEGIGREREREGERGSVERKRETAIEANMIATGTRSLSCQRSLSNSSIA